MRNQSGRRLPNYVLGLILVVVLAVGGYVAFTKNVPWGGGTEFQAVFNSAQNLRADSPVRIAGVEVGKVTKVEPMGGDEAAAEEGSEVGAVQSGALVTMEIDDDGLPLKEDATFKLRPRLFLEGNLFVDVRPGSPTAPAVDAEYTFPPQQTSNSVQLDEIFTGVLQSDARQDLQIFFDQFGVALIDEGGAESLQLLNRVSPSAFESTSQVNQALLGENPHDLSSLIANLDRVVRGLDANEGALTSLVSNLRTTTGSFASEADALEAALLELPNTLDAGETAFASLNASFPSMRAFAREALPGTRTAPETLEVTTPLLRQLRGLASEDELRGLVADLRPTVPRLAKLTRKTIPFLNQVRELSSCFNKVIIPWANDEIDGGEQYNMTHGPKGRVFEETAYGLAGIAGESRSGDANGQYIRVIGGGGSNTVQSVDDANNPDETLNGVGLSPFPIQGAMPPIESSAKTPFRPEAPCENQAPPDLRAVPGAPPPQNPLSANVSLAPSDIPDVMIDANQALRSLTYASAAAERGDVEVAKKAGKIATEELRDFDETYGGE